jgi:hypothetical protein
MQQRIAQLEDENAKLRAGLLDARGNSPRVSDNPPSTMSPRKGSMLRMSASGMRQARTPGGRPLLKGHPHVGGEELAQAEAPASDTGTKADFRLLLCNDDTCEVLVPAGPAVRSAPVHLESILC